MNHHSLCLKKNHGKLKIYPVIDITSKDKRILIKIAEWSNKHDIKNCIVDDSYRDKRTGKFYTKFKFQSSGYKNTAKWIASIGSSNPTKIQRMNFVKEKMGWPD